MTTEKWQQAADCGADTKAIEAQIGAIWSAHTQMHHTIMGVLGWRKYKKDEAEAIAHLHLEKITTLGDVVKALRTYRPGEELSRMLDEVEVLNNARNYVLHGILMHNVAAAEKQRDEDYGFGRSTRAGGEFRIRPLSDLDFWNIDKQMLKVVSEIKAELGVMQKAA